MEDPRNKTCPAGDCENCMWYRKFQFTNTATSEVKVESRCALDMLITEILMLIPNLDGVQRAANEGRNAVWGMAAGMAAHGYTAPLKALQTNVGERVLKSLEEPEEVELIEE